VAVDDSTLYFVNSGTAILAAYSIEDGGVRWATSVVYAGSAPAVADGKVFTSCLIDYDSDLIPYPGFSTPALWAVDATDGHVIWKAFECPGCYSSSDPCVRVPSASSWVSVPAAGFVAYEGLQAWKVLDASTGGCIIAEGHSHYDVFGHQPLWPTAPVALGEHGYTLAQPPATSTLEAYWGPYYDIWTFSSTGRQTVVDATTSTQAPVSTGPCTTICPISCPFAPSAPPVNVGDGNVVFATSAHLLCRRATTVDQSSVADTDLVDPARRVLAARDRATGSVMWRGVPASELGTDLKGVPFRLLQTWSYSMTDRPCSVAEAHGRIYLLTANKLIVVSAADGCVLDSRPVTASTMVTLTDNAVIFGDGQGYVHVLDPTTLADLQLVHATDSPLIGEVAVTDNGLFVVASDGTIARLYTEPCKTLSPGYPQNGHQAIGPYGVFTVPDVGLPFAGVPVNLRRTFNNQVASDIHEFTADGTVVPGDAVFSGTLFSTSLGRGWTHSYDQALTPELDPVSGATLYLVSDGRGRTVGYTMTLTGAMINPPGVHDGFSFTPTGAAWSATFTGMDVILRNKRGGSRRFDPEGNLSCISDPIGNRLVFSYEPATVINPAAPGVRLTRIVYLSATDMGAAMPASVTVYLEYDAMARLSKVGYPNPSSTWFVATTYAYDDAGRLSDVAAPSGVRCHYEYT